MPGSTGIFSPPASSLSFRPLTAIPYCRRGAGYHSWYVAPRGSPRRGDGLPIRRTSPVDSRSRYYPYRTANGRPVPGLASPRKAGQMRRGARMALRSSTIRPTTGCFRSSSRQRATGSNPLSRRPMFPVGGTGAFNGAIYSCRHMMPTPLFGLEPNHRVLSPRCWNALTDSSEHSGTTATSGPNERSASIFLSSPIWQFHVTIRISINEETCQRF